MQHEIGEVVTSGVESEQLDVFHVGQPRDRVPIGRIERGEGPRDAVFCQPVLDVLVGGDVHVVVVVQESVRQRA